MGIILEEFIHQSTHKSILDVDPAVQALLELAGKKMHSEGLREGDETAGTPDVEQLYPAR